MSKMFFSIDWGRCIGCMLITQLDRLGWAGRGREEKKKVTDKFATVTLTPLLPVESSQHALGWRRAAPGWLDSTGRVLVYYS